MKPDLVTKLVFNNSVVLEISSDYEDTIMIDVSNVDDPVDGGRQFHLHPDEVDLLMAALTLYKDRIKGGNF